MPESPGPAVNRRKLKQELRELRERAGLSQATVVKNFDWSLSKLVRIENGTVGVSVPDLLALTALYGVQQDRVAGLVELSRLAKQSRWWTPYRHILSPQMQQFLGFEADAARTLMFHSSVVPGILQTDGYIDAVAQPLSLKPVENSQAEELKIVRRRRRQELLGEDSPEIEVLLDEAVLRRQVGGPQVMADQLSMLVKLQESDKISLGILPFTKGAHFGMTGAFHIMEFSDDADDAVLYVENAQSTLTLQDKAELVLQYKARFKEMADLAVHGSEAIEFLQKIALEMRAP